MFREYRFGKVQTAALVVVALVMGANLISPAVAHVTTKLKHLVKHLDSRYYNVKEKVGDADRLDGQDSTEFLAATAKATDAERLDGIDSTDLIPGGTLPSGSTILGHYANYGRADGTAHFIAGEGISFGFRLASAPTPQVILAGQPSTANCPGTASDPAAAPGFLCVYEHDSQNKRDNTYPSVGVGLTGGVANPFGASIATQSSNTTAGFFWSRGTWAVTAP